MSRVTLRQLKKNIKELVETDDFNTIKTYVDKESRTLSVLYSMSYDKNSISCWRCIQYIGRIVGRLGDDDYEAARGYIRRFMWDVTEESGTIGWSVPEILGETIRENPAPFMDIIPLIFSLYDEEMPFRSGVLYAIGRIGEKYPEYVKDGLRLIKKGLETDDKEISASAIVTAKRLKLHEMDEIIKKLKDKKEKIKLYSEGKLIDFTIGELARSDVI